MKPRFVWIAEPRHPWSELAALPTTVKEAARLTQHILGGGQLVTSPLGTGLVDSHLLCVLFSLALEERRGVDVVARYADCGELGPTGTAYGAEIGHLASGDTDEERADTSDATVRFARVMTVERYRPKHHGVPAMPNLRIGRDFS